MQQLRKFKVQRGNLDPSLASWDVPLVAVPYPGWYPPTLDQIRYLPCPSNARLPWILFSSSLQQISFGWGWASSEIPEAAVGKAKVLVCAFVESPLWSWRIAVWCCWMGFAWVFGYWQYSCCTLFYAANWSTPSPLFIFSGSPCHWRSVVRSSTYLQHSTLTTTR